MKNYASVIISGTGDDALEEKDLASTSMPGAGHARLVRKNSFL